MLFFVVALILQFFRLLSVFLSVSFVWPAMSCKSCAALISCIPTMFLFLSKSKIMFPISMAPFDVECGL